MYSRAEKYTMHEAEKKGPRIQSKIRGFVNTFSSQKPCEPHFFNKANLKLGLMQEKVMGMTVQIMEEDARQGVLSLSIRKKLF